MSNLLDMLDELVMSWVDDCDPFTRVTARALLEKGIVDLEAGNRQLQQQVAELEKRNAYLEETSQMVIAHNTAKTKEIARLESDRTALVRKALEAAINAIPGGSICDPQQIADLIRDIDPSTIANEASNG